MWEPIPGSGDRVMLSFLDTGPFARTNVDAFNEALFGLVSGGTLQPQRQSRERSEAPETSREA